MTTLNFGVIEVFKSTLYTRHKVDLKTSITPKFSVVINYQKGGEGALECFDLGGAHGLLMEIIRLLMDFLWRSFVFGFRLPLMFICILYELYLRLVFGFEPWFVMCDELC